MTIAANLRRSFKKIAKEPKQVLTEAGPESLGIKLSDVLAYLSMCEKHRWLINTRRLFDPTKIKRKDKIKSIHDDLLVERSSYPEFVDYKGDLGLYFITMSGQLLSELASTVNEDELLVAFASSDDLTEFIYSHLDYNFFKRFKKKLPTVFEEPEQRFLATCEKYSIMGRYSWNASVEKEIKEAFDMNFMEDYA